MNDPLVQIVRQNQVSLEPLPTGVPSRIARLEDLRAVVFDIYGTLLISGSGDVGTSESAEKKAYAAEQAWQSLGLRAQARGSEMATVLQEAILRDHERRQQEGVEYPEVDIVEIWKNVVQRLGDQLGLSPAEIDCRRLAVEYEVRANPVDAMPGAASILDQLRSAGMVLGIVSNAQFFTPIVWEACFGSTITEMGFAADVQYYSYEHGRAKPGTHLYRLAAHALAARGIACTEVLYVGNDMRNDIWPASQVGFRTALFAGDQRSLRLRTDDASLPILQPDIVISRLGQLAEAVGLS